MINFNNKNLYENIVKHIDNKLVRKKVYSELARLPFCMEQNEFEKLIELLLEYPDGVEALKNNWRIILNNVKNSINILQIYRKNNEISEEVLKDIPYLINYSNIDDAGIIAKQISYFTGGRDAIAKNFENLIKFSHTNLDLIFSSALDTPDGKKAIKENLKILQNNPKDFFKFIISVKDIDEFKEEYNKYSFWAELYFLIDTYDSEIGLSENHLYNSYEKSNRKNIYFQKRERIFYNLLKSNDEELEEKRMILEKVANGNKFKYKTMGNDSIVFQAGNQIIKLGEDFENQYKIPYHPRIMMPYFRKKYKDNSVLSVFNLGNVKSIKITDEKLLEIYKELEEAGILWGDARKDNLLVLLSDNTLPDFIRSADFNLFGFLKDDRFPTNNHKPLKKGDIVICDLGFLFAKGDPNYTEGRMDLIISKYILKKSIETKRNFSGR